MGGYTGVGGDDCTGVGTGGVIGSDGGVIGADGGIGTGGGTPTGLGTGGVFGAACSSITFDHAVLCEEIPGARDAAATDCQARGQNMVDFGPVGTCLAGDERRLTYVCCPPVENPSPTDPNI